MKTKALTICFMIIVFTIAVFNVGNAIVATQPVIKEYVLDESVEDVNSAKELIGLVESTYNDGFVPKMKFVEIQGINRRVIGSRYYNTVMKLNNGYLTYQYDTADVETYAKNIIQLSHFVKQRGSEFIYVAVPFKTSPKDVDIQIPKGSFERSNDNQNKMLKILSDNGIDNYDLRVPLAADFDDWYSAFFRTDQHWKPETGFWAYQQMSSLLSEKYGYTEDPKTKDISNYNIDVYKKRFLGSQGKKTGIIYSGLDDFSLIYPKFETNMTVDVPVHDDHRAGSYYDVMLRPEFLEKDYYNINTYCSYIGGDYPLCIQKNANAKNNKKLLILKDSFTIAFQPYMSFVFDEVDVIDLRHYKKSLKNYIEKTNPDIVMIFYTSSMMTYPEAYQYGLD